MFSRKTLGIAGAAIVGTLVGTNAAHAAFSVDDDGTQGAVTYAKETLLTIGSVEADGKTYYVVGDDDSADGDNELDVRLAANIVPRVPGTAGEKVDVTITYSLTNMVFTGAMDAINPPVWTQATTPSDVMRTGASAASRLSGGRKGSKEVQYGLSFTNPSTPLATDIVVFDIDKIAVSPDAPGSITMRIQYRFGGSDIAESTTIRDAVKVPAMALKEDVSAIAATADADEEFKKFDGSATIARLGTLAIYVGDGYRAATSSALIANNAAGVASLLGTGGGTVTFGGGEVGFAERVFLRSSCASGSGATELLQTTNDVKTLKTAKHTAVPPGGTSFCIEVDGETAIPDTGPFTATTSYVALANAAFPPEGGSHNLGSIGRAGTAFHIPYLTVDNRYRQRLVIMNTGTAATTYALTFTAPAGVTATAGAAATGPLPTGVTILNLGNANANPGGGEVVTIEGGRSTSATLRVPVSSDTIEVSTTVLNRGDGSTDTVVYDKEPE